MRNLQQRTQGKLLWTSLIDRKREQGDVVRGAQSKVLKEWWNMVGGGTRRLIISYSKFPIVPIVPDDVQTYFIRTFIELRPRVGSRNLQYELLKYCTQYEVYAHVQ